MRLRAVINAAILTSVIVILILPIDSRAVSSYTPVGPDQVASLHEGGRFIPNQGQWPDEVKFRAMINGVTVWFTTEGLFHDFVRQAGQAGSDNQSRDIERFEGPSPQYERLMVASKFMGSNQDGSVVGVGERTERVNLFHGNDQSQWLTDLPVYDQIEYRSLYDGVDLVYRVSEGQLEYDLRVAPGSDYSAVQFEYQNVNEVTVEGDGSLSVTTAWGKIVERAPQVYQEASAGVTELRGEFNLTGQNTFKFNLLDRPDPSYPIIVDPLVSYIFGDGGSGNDEGFGIAVGDDGSSYVVGYTASTDFPTQNPLQPNSGGGLYDAIVMKLSADGSQIVWSTYLGGSDDDRGHAIVLDNSGAVYLTGYTISTDFPIASAYQSMHGGGVYDVFVTKISPNGNALAYSTYLGGLGADIGNGIAVNSDGQAHLTGQTRSTNFPTVDPMQAELPSVNYDAFVSKFNATGSDLLYSSYLGGKSSDYGRDIVVLSTGNALVCGFTGSLDFPTLLPYQDSLQGGSDAFVTSVSINLSGPGFSTFLGGSDDDYADGISIDSDFTIVLSGYTFSDDFPTLNPYQANHAGGLRDIFATRLSHQGNALIYSTYLGGSAEDYAYGSALTPEGELCITGSSFSSDFPLVNAYKSSLSGVNDAIMTVLSADGSNLRYSTFIGGNLEDIGYHIAVDTGGNIYVTGVTGELFSTSIEPGDGQSAPSGLSDIFVMKFGASSSGGCCGQFTSGFTGNADCSADGKRNLADITRLIDRVYLSKLELCCEANGNVDGDPAGKINLADITRMIDHVYLSKSQTAPCL